MLVQPAVTPVRGRGERAVGMVVTVSMAMPVGSYVGLHRRVVVRMVIMCVTLRMAVVVMTMRATRAVHMRLRRQHRNRDGPRPRGRRDGWLMRTGMCVVVAASGVIAVIVPCVTVSAVIVMVMPAVAMAMSAAGIGATFGLETRVFLADDQVHLAQHVGQHVVGFELEVVRLQFELHMPVAQVVGRPQQVEG